MAASEQFDRLARAIGALSTAIVAAESVVGPISPSGSTVPGTLASVTVSSTTSGQNILVAGVANQAVRLYGLELWANGSNGISILSGTTGGTTLWPLHNYLANSGVILDLRADPWFTGAAVAAAANNALILNLTGSGQVTGIIYYAQAA